MSIEVIFLVMKLFFFIGCYFLDINVFVLLLGVMESRCIFYKYFFIIKQNLCQQYKDGLILGNRMNFVSN